MGDFKCFQVDNWHEPSQRPMIYYVVRVNVGLFSKGTGLLEGDHQMCASEKTAGALIPPLNTSGPHLATNTCVDLFMLICPGDS